MTSRWIAVLFLLSTPALAALQATENQDNMDIGGLLSGSKKPCDEDKKQAAAAPKPEDVAQAQNSDKAVQGLINLGVIPAEKQQAEPEKKSLGALPGPMEKCK